VLLKQLADFFRRHRDCTGLQSRLVAIFRLAELISSIFWAIKIILRREVPWNGWSSLSLLRDLRTPILPVKKGTVQKNYSTFAMAVLKEMKVKNGTVYYFG